MTRLENFTFFTGTITILEITSVLTREEKVFKEALVNLSKEIDIRDLISLSFEEQIIIIIEFLFKSFNITILDEPVLETIQINEKKISIQSLYVLGIKWAEKIKLRTLDLIHLMTIVYYNQLKNVKFDYFITSDRAILGKRVEIQANIESLVTDPEGLLKIER